MTGRKAFLARLIAAALVLCAILSLFTGAVPPSEVTETPVPEVTDPPLLEQTGDQDPEQSPEITETPAPEETSTPGPEVTDTPVPEATDTPVPQESPEPSATAEPTAVPEPDATPEGTEEPEESPEPSATPEPTEEPEESPEPEHSGYPVRFRPTVTETGEELTRTSSVEYKYYDGAAINAGEPVVLEDDRLTVYMEPGFLYEVTVFAFDASGAAYVSVPAEEVDQDGGTGEDPEEPALAERNGVAMLIWMDGDQPIQLSKDGLDDLKRDYPALEDLLEDYLKECERQEYPDTYFEDILKAAQILSYEYDQEEERDVAAFTVPVIAAETEEDEPEPTATPVPEAEAWGPDRFEGLMTIEELKELDPDVAGATVEYSPIMPVNLVQSDDGNWAFNIYYVNEANTNHVSENSDFGLKYQMEFHASKDYEAGEVEIRIPASLFKDRNGNLVLPAEIAVPKVSGPNESIPMRTSSFNYYVDEKTGELVFFNYEKIPSGTNDAWQILYRNISAMQTPDGTTWELTAKATVTDDGTSDTQTPAPLTGEVNTEAHLDSLTKKPYSSGRSYTPGLYSKEQVESYIGGELQGDYADNFDNYKYVVWECEATGHGNQPFDLWFKDTADDHGGQIVGYKGMDNNGTAVPDGYDMTDEYIQKLQDGSYTSTRQNSASSSWTERYYVVTAYPKDSISEDTEVKNSAEAILVPSDKKDPAQYKNADAQWPYKDYHWDTTKGKISSSLSKSAGKTDYPAWLDVYEGAAGGKTEESRVPTFSFTTRNYLRYFELTHNVSEANLGERIPGVATRMVTVDDAIYAYPTGTAASGRTLLDKEDYYFTNVSVSLTERGYDVYEDTYAAPETANLDGDTGVDQGMKVYAMFAKNGDGQPNENPEWEQVGVEVPWGEVAGTGTSHTLSFTFTPEQLAREPFRVKVEHDVVNYEAECHINVTVRIRSDSEKVKKLFDEHTTAMEFENVAGLSYQLLEKGEASDGKYTDGDYSVEVENLGTNGYYHTMGTSAGEDNDTKNANHYDLQYLENKTKELYESLLLNRTVATVKGSRIGKDAHASKQSSTTNDPVSGRVNVTYYMTAYDGYLVDSNDMANFLIQQGLPDPARNEIVFYDLLPSGMKYDPSVQPVAGRITSLGGSYQTQPRSWDDSLVTVRAETVDSNYEGTGRTLMAFHVSYGGENKAAFYSGHFFEGWGVSFQGYWNWEDLSISKYTKNICAVMPELPKDTAQQVNPFVAGDGQAYADDGNFPDDDYSNFGSDIDNDTRTGAGSVLFAKDQTTMDPPVAFSSTITKTVRADSDPFGVFGPSAVVEVGGTYTYRINVENMGDAINNIVIFDRLEHASIDRKGVTGEIEFDDTCWTGTFDSIITQELTERNITFTVYYNAARDAKLPTAADDPSSVLTDENGWIEKSEWEKDHTPAQVQAVAVKLAEDFKLENGNSVAIEICMKAPDAMPESGTTWAYNNPSFYSKRAGASGVAAPQTVEGDSVRVRMGTPQDVEIIKEVTNPGDVPSSLSSKEFEFTVSETDSDGKTSPFAEKQYKLYEKLVTGEWMWDGHLYGTDSNGRFRLKNGQKAVFEDVPSADRLTVKETDDPFWKCEQTTGEIEPDDGFENEGISYAAKNTYRTVLYVKKTAIGGAESAAGAEFTMQLLVNGEEPGEEIPFWYVDNAYTDGRIPSRVPEADGEAITEGHTDSNGQFKIKSGQIIALLGPGNVGDSYTVKEVVDPAGDWVCEEDTAEGELAEHGAEASFTNYYKWKDLLLTKTVTHQDAADAAKQMFRFRVDKITQDGAGKDVFTPVTDVEWVLEVDGEEEPTEKGTLTDGIFECHAAKGVVRIKKLEAQAEYQITELTEGLTEPGSITFYTPVNGGVAEVVMPLYSDTASATVTNDWQKRPLSVSKTLIYDASNPDQVEEAKKAVFEMTVQSDYDHTGTQKVLKDWPFTITQNGVEVTPGDTEKDPYKVGKQTNPGEDENIFKTGSDGKFYLMAGQTATFKDAGVQGDKFTVTEDHDTMFEQISPADNKPIEGEIGGEGASVSFINGEKGSILISKQWNGEDADFVDDDLEDVAAAFLAEASDPDSDDEYDALAIRITMQTAGADGELKPWPTEAKQVTLINSKGETSTVTWPAATDDENPGITIHAGDTVALISTVLGEDVVSYEVTETMDTSAGDFWLGSDIREYMYKDRRYWVQAEPMIPEADAGGVLTGTVADAPAVNFVNKLLVRDEACEVYKRMTTDSTRPSDNSVLTFVVERYTSGAWLPADGVEYMLPTQAGEGDKAANVTSGAQATGTDGRIRVLTWPVENMHIVFPNDMVYVQDAPKQPDGTIAEGTLRIREDLSNSNSEWGHLVGVGSADGEDYTMDLKKYNDEYAKDNVMNGVPAAAFVNSNVGKPVRIGKTVEGDGDLNTEFTMNLAQVTGIDAEQYDAASGNILPENYKGIITATELRSGVPYTIYDETGAMVGTGVTGPNGEIVLQHGQYAEFIVPEETMWEVSESMTPGFTLKSMTPYNAEIDPQLEKLEDNLTLIGSHAEWQKEPGGEDWEEYDVKYAVSIYGINQDVDETGDKIGLTFGPATGADYTKTTSSSGGYKACSGTSAEAPGNCMHWMTWDQIIKKAKTDPTSFQSCLQNGCTHEVRLKLPDTIKSSSTYSSMTGDGASILYSSLNSNYRKWNNTNTNSGGWPASRIRAMLNGPDEKTNNSNAGMDGFTVDDALISAFPPVLQGAIKAKAVKSDTVYNDISDNNATTYDRLWLFSGREVYSDSGSSSNVIRPNEGTAYARASDKGITTSSYSGNIGYNEAGSAYHWWLRSVSRAGNATAYIVYSSGYCFSVSTDNTSYGVAPGFCIG